MLQDLAVVSGAKQIIQGCLGLSNECYLFIFPEKATSETISAFADAGDGLTLIPKMYSLGSGL